MRGTIDPRAASPREAAGALEEIDRLRRRTRESLGPPWLPLAYFGAVTMLSAPLVAVAGVAVLAPLWVLAGALGLIVMGRAQAHRSRARGLTGRSLGAWSIGVAMLVGCIAAGVAVGRAAGQDGGVLAPIVVVLAGYTGLGWLRRDARPVAVLAPGAALAAGLALDGAAPWLVELTFGAALSAAGLVLRSLARS
jgi:hypothetical protein